MGQTLELWHDAHEEARLLAVERLNVLDTPPEEPFDRITRLVSALFETPITLISILDRDRQWHKSRIGTDATEVPREVTFCDQTIRQKSVMCVPDATADARFRDNPFVTSEPGIRFYAGVPLITAEGHAVGVLCIVAYEPRPDLSAEQRARLEDLGKLVVEELDRRGNHTTAERLQRNAATLQLLDDHSADMIVRSDRQGNRTYVSAACRKILGREPADLVGRPAMLIVHPEDWFTVTKLAEKVFNTGNDAQLTYRLLHRENHWVWLEGTVSRCFNPETGAAELITVVRDVTHRMACDVALRESEASFKLLFERNPVPMWVCERESLRFLQVNAAAIKQYGYSQQQFLGMTIADIRPPEERVNLRALVTRAEQAPLHEVVEVRHCRADGSLIDVEVVAQLLDYKGRDAALVAAFDVTDRNRTQVELLAAKAAAEDANRAKSQFLANMSHELRTPLNAILGFSEIIRDGCFGSVDPRRYRSYAEDIHASGRHLLAVITDILDLSKVEADKIELTEETVDIGAVLESSCRLLSQRATNGGVTLDIQVDPAVPLVHADELRLKQVMVNLLSNAVKFTDPGGFVGIQAECRLGELVITVADTGCGMAPEAVPLAFLPFTQLNTDVARRRGGTGLGLPLAKRLVELHGGRMEMTSRLAAGTTVQVILPQSRVLAATGDQAWTDGARLAVG